MFSITICRYSQHVWCACWAFKGFHQAHILFLKTAEGKFSKDSVEGITTNTTHLERRMILFWLIKVFEVRNSKMLQMKTVLTRPVQSDRCSSIFRNACWDNAGLANFICSNDVNTSNLNSIWQLAVAGQYLYSSKSLIPGFHLQEQIGQHILGRHRLYAP